MLLRSELMKLESSVTVQSPIGTGSTALSIYMVGPVRDLVALCTPQGGGKPPHSKMVRESFVGLTARILDVLPFALTGGLPVIRTAISRVVFLAGVVIFFEAATNICAQSRAT